MLTAVYDRLDDTSVSTVPLLDSEDVKSSIALTADSSPSPITESLTVTPVKDEVYQHNQIKIVECVGVAYLLLESFGMRRRKDDRQVKESFDTTVLLWTAQAARLGKSGWMTFAKYKFASFVHLMTGSKSEPPTAPKGISDLTRMFVCGVAGRFALRLSKDKEKRMAFIQSVTDLKKGCPRPGDSELSEALSKTYAILSTERQIVREDADNVSRLYDVKENKLGERELVRLETIDLIHEVNNGIWSEYPDVGELSPSLEDQLNYESAKRQLVKTVDEIFGGLDYPSWKLSRTPMQMASTSSSYQSSRKKGGAINDICKSIYDKGLRDEHLVFYGEEESFNLFAEAQKFVDIDPLINQQYKLFDELYADFINGNKSMENLVSMVSLSEALKVRVITKGNPYRTYLLQPVQKFLWESLFKHDSKVFELIGEPVNPEIVERAMGKRLKEGFMFLSGDYSQATNLLAPWASEIVARRICEICNFTETDTQLVIDALTHHILRNPDDKKEFKDQKWGQLMGSIVSFPILCIVNAAVCRWALEVEYYKPKKLRDCALLINGDDCLLKVTERGYKAWKVISSYFGLSPSLGKFFLTDEFAQINSMNFVFSREASEIRDKYIYSGGRMHKIPRPCSFSETPYINFGLFLNLSRSKSETDDVELDGIGYGARCREMIKKAPTSVRVDLMQMWLDHHRLFLRKHFSNIPFFVPEKFGGLGLPMFSNDLSFFTSKPVSGEASHYPNLYYLGGKDRDWFPTNLDKKCCRHFIRTKLPGKIGIPKLWLIRDLAARLLPAPRVSSVRDENSEMLLNLLGISLMFAQNNKELMNSMKPEVLNKRANKQRYDLMKRWTEAVAAAEKLDPLPIEEILVDNPLYDVYDMLLKSEGRILGPSEVQEFIAFNRYRGEIDQMQSFLDNMW
jgi:hypothetical protein